LSAQLRATILPVETSFFVRSCLLSLMVTEVVSRVATTIASSKHQESTKGPVVDPTGVFFVLTVS
jgi:hypothetical protein